MDNARLQAAISDVSRPIYPSGFKEIAEGYREKFTERTWRGELAAQIAGSRDSKSMEYKAARRNVERWYTGKSNFDRARSGNKAAVEKAGQQLPAKHLEVKDKQGIVWTVKGDTAGEKGHSPRQREFQVSMDYATATKFVNKTNVANEASIDWEELWEELFDSWWDGAWDAYGDDGDYTLDNVTVSAY